MRGFIKIIEAVIASIILLTAMTFFFSAEAKYPRWGASLMQAEARDALAALNKSGAINKFITRTYTDANARKLAKIEITDTLEAMLSGSTDFSLEIRGLPDPKINIICVCSQTELDDLKARLGITGDGTNVTYNGRNIEINTGPYKDPVSINELNTVANGARQAGEPVDIAVAFDKTIINNNENEIAEFLSNGGNVLLIADLAEADVTDALAGLFGLAWDTNAVNAQAGKLYFTDSTSYSEPVHRICKYIIGTYSGTDIICSKDDNTEFDSFHKNRTGINYIAADFNTIIVSPNPNNPKRSFVKANLIGDARTAWMAGYEWATPDDLENKLLKAILMWASGERIQTTIPEKGAFIKSVKSYSTVKYMHAGISEPEPYEAVLTYWNVFY